MKLKVGNKVYLQNYDYAFITHDLDEVPTYVTIYNKPFIADEIFFLSSREDSLRFACPFDNPEAIQWLMDQDWIVDYEQYVDMPISKLKTTIETLKTEHSAKINEFNVKDPAYRETHYLELLNEYKKGEHRIGSLQLLFSARLGKVKFIFPEGYKSPSITSTFKKKFNFFAWLFSRSAH